MLQVGKIERFRIEKNITQEELAKKSGLSLGGYNSLRNHKNPKLKTLIAISKVLDVSVFDLLKEEEKPSVVNEDEKGYGKNCSKCKKLEKQIEQQLDHIELLMEECGRKKNSSAG